LLICVVAGGVNEEKLLEEFRAEYRDQEPEDPYREQKLPEDFEDGKSNSTLLCIFYPCFYRHNLLA
jgi:hypothetical protein